MNSQFNKSSGFTTMEVIVFAAVILIIVSMLFKSQFQEKMAMKSFKNMQSVSDIEQAIINGVGSSILDYSVHASNCGNINVPQTSPILDNTNLVFYEGTVDAATFGSYPKSLQEAIIRCQNYYKEDASLFYFCGQLSSDFIAPSNNFATSDFAFIELNTQIWHINTGARVNCHTLKNTVWNHYMVKVYSTFHWLCPKRVDQKMVNTHCRKDGVYHVFQ